MEKSGVEFAATEQKFYSEADAELLKDKCDGKGEAAGFKTVK